MNRLKEFITDDSGKLSSGRALMILLILAYIGYAGYVVITTKTVPDIPSGVSLLAAGLYTINKFSPTTPFNGGGQ
ncbi:MAG: hypothetical protein M0Z71_04750 [Nitrospiraceae bacterium]|nr:hypothetical protein [Nitrospiraceae bacterium]